MAASGDGREGWASGFRRGSGSVTSAGWKWGPGGFSVNLAPECWISKGLAWNWSLGWAYVMLNLFMWTRVVSPESSVRSLFPLFHSNGNNTIPYAS